MHSVAAESVAPQSVLVVTAETGVPHSQWCKMDQRRAATRQRCDRSMDDVFRTECDEVGELSFPDVRTQWFPHRTVGMSSAFGWERWPFSRARTVWTHVFGLGQFDFGKEETGRDKGDWQQHRKTSAGSGRWSCMTAGWATDMKNVEQEIEGTCADAVEIVLQIEQES